MADLFPRTSWNSLTASQLAGELVIGEELAAIAEHVPELIVCVADLAYPTGTFKFGERWPDRFYNFGISERNMVSAAAGMCTTGFKPYVVSYAPFMALHCAEEIRNDVAYPNLPVRLLATHGGITMGFYGTSHHATEDLAAMRAMANLTVIVATDGNLLRSALRASVEYPGPIYFRLGRGREPRVYDAPPARFEIGKGLQLRDGDDMSILACGQQVAAALNAADILAERGVSARVIDLHTIKPLDRDLIYNAARETGVILTVEEHNVIGGMGSAVAELLAESGLSCTFRRHGLPDEYAVIGPPTRLYEHYKLDAAGIAQVALDTMGPTRG